MANRKFAAGQKYHMLTLVSKEKDGRWLCLCECSEKKEVSYTVLGRQFSCGCYMNDPLVRKRMSETIKKALSDPLVRKRMSEARKKALSDPLVRKRMSEATKKQMSDPLVRKRMSEATKKRWNNPLARKRRSEATKKQMSDPLVRKRMSEATKKRWNNPLARKRRSEALLNLSYEDFVEYLLGFGLLILNDKSQTVWRGTKTIEEIKIKCIAENHTFEKPASWFLSRITDGCYVCFPPREGCVNDIIERAKHRQAKLFCE